MADMLVKLYELPSKEASLEGLGQRSIMVRHARPYEKHKIVAWVKEAFGRGWASECEGAFGYLPVSCFIAVRNQEILGFACYECTCKNYFGPLGVHQIYRQAGIGSALLLSSLHAMAAMGYAYAIIGGIGEELNAPDNSHDFYSKVCRATLIEGSTPGIYSHRLI